MQTVFLPAYELGAGPVPVQIARFEDRTLIQCDSASTILHYLGAVDGRLDEFRWMKIKGVTIPGEGAFFELFDRFGRVTAEPLRFPIEVVDQRLLNGVIWQVQTATS